jgi:glycosyltransferase involved in cell wall biosynthesis
MRILFLTNFYPPASLGGYEQWCQEIAENLRSRGHDLVVLTSSYGRAGLPKPEPTWIRRELHLEMELASLRNGLQFFTSRKSREKENLSRLQQLVESFLPDTILVWGMWNLSRSLPALAEKLLPQRVVYYMGDYWPTLPSQFETYWQMPPRNWVTAVPKFLLKPVADRVLSRGEQPALRFERVIFPSAFMRDELKRKNISPRETMVVYGAIDTSLYRYGNGSSGGQQEDNLSLLYIGRLTPDKGVHVAIEAMGCLVHQWQYDHLRLTIVGTGEPDYEAYLHRVARQEDVDSVVDFLGAQSKEAMPTIYGQSDILLFTSLWPEPFGRVLVEAMASGVAVVGTATGGAAEILVENENALLFAPGDAIGLARQVARLIKLPLLRQELTRAGRRIAVAKFDLQRMAAEIETYLQTILADSVQIS